MGFHVAWGDSTNLNPIPQREVKRDTRDVFSPDCHAHLDITVENRRLPAPSAQ